jgi:hypothetical protein
MNEMGGAYNTYGHRKSADRVLVGKPEEKTRHGLKDNVKFYL